MAHWVRRCAAQPSGRGPTARGFTPAQLTSAGTSTAACSGKLAISGPGVEQVHRRNPHRVRLLQRADHGQGTSPLGRSTCSTGTSPRRSRPRDRSAPLPLIRPPAPARRLSDSPAHSATCARGNRCRREVLADCVIGRVREHVVNARHLPVQRRHLHRLVLLHPAQGLGKTFAAGALVLMLRAQKTWLRPAVVTSTSARGRPVSRLASRSKSNTPWHNPIARTLVRCRWRGERGLPGW